MYMVLTIQLINHAMKITKGKNTFNCIQNLFACESRWIFVFKKYIIFEFLQDISILNM